MAASQQTLSAMRYSDYRLQISDKWDVLGPFPIHAREQHHLSPSYPLNLSEPIDFEKSWPSSYADGGRVGWTTTTMTDHGELRVSFPDIRWKYLRSFEGWAALQHHAVLRTTFKIASHHETQTRVGDAKLNILVHLHQGSYFTVLPKESFREVTPRWYAGNIYDLPRSLPHVVELPPSKTGEYQIFLSGDYEIRLFGDPVVQEGSDVPVQNIKVEVQLESHHETWSSREPSHDVVCDFVDGYAFGDTIGIGLRSHEAWVTIEDAYIGPQSPTVVEVELKKSVRIAPGQTRIVPLKLRQRSPTQVPVLEVILKMTADTSTGLVSGDLLVLLPLRHLPRWSDSDQRTPIMASYLYAGSNPTIFSVLPPLLAGEGRDRPPILALHGAGVDVVDLHRDFWANAMPRNNVTWVVMPSGRTSWGLDWHGPSAKEAWASVSALSDILGAHDAWMGQAFPRDTKVVVIGHSNGGQGVWHLAAHFPDRVIAAVPAAAYIKSQAYIPLTHSRSARYIDPMLRAVLETSLTPDDNDLHLSNTAHLPLLAVHGGADENVPSWHSRELLSVLHTFSPQNNTTLKEDPGQGHWYEWVLNNPTVQEFVDLHVGSASLRPRPDSFTLTVSNPSESGPLHGWRINKLLIPGRLGFLHVIAVDGGLLAVSPTNVLQFAIENSLSLSNVKELVVASKSFSLTDFPDFPVVFTLDKGQWITTKGSRSIVNNNPPPTRLQMLLSSQSTIRILYGEEPAFSLARRFAHDLLTYHRLDAELLEPSSKVGESLVVIGTLQSPQIQQILERRKTSFNLRQGQLYLEDKLVDTMSGQSCLFLHPTSMPKEHMLVIVYSDEASLERAGRLFPIRTGVAAPDWLCLSPKMDQLGAAGLRGAGVWGSNWKFQLTSSWWAD